MVHRFDSKDHKCFTEHGSRDEKLLYNKVIRKLIENKKSLKKVLKELDPWGCNAIYVPYGDVPPIRVYFLAFKSKTGCLFFEPDSKTGWQICTITPSQGAYFQNCLALPLVLTHLSFFSKTSCCV